MANFVHLMSLLFSQDEKYLRWDAMILLKMVQTNHFIKSIQIFLNSFQCKDVIDELL